MVPPRLPDQVKLLPAKLPAVGSSTVKKVWLVTSAPPAIAVNACVKAPPGITSARVCAGDSVTELGAVQLLPPPVPPVPPVPPEPPVPPVPLPALPPVPLPPAPPTVSSPHALASRVSPKMIVSIRIIAYRSGLPPLAQLGRLRLHRVAYCRLRECDPDRGAQVSATCAPLESPAHG